ncbi:BglG family transcription antiterminator [Marinococcus sp. PL1-022]|uniref:BglG family transcription antiterminator n=1 Tax=Marinococcus sp. PL1-022 TaxID=3095363 RepID=UPI0029C38F40|nr:BglG family transcription antiterminator [Marinococcus sp. PL1-022]MDX6152539.1 BglG family transcription antiterminator [Marinococcus sp. PL1-022]
MALDQRSLEILSNLLETEEPLSVSYLAGTFQVSERSIYLDLDKISHWMKENHFSGLGHQRSRGYFIEPFMKRAIAESGILYQQEYIYSREERKSVIYLILISSVKDKWMVADFQELFRVSRNTVLDDVRLLREELKAWSLSISFDLTEGYRIKGLEKDKRRKISHLLHYHFTEEGRFSFSFFSRLGESMNFLQYSAVKHIETVIHQIEEAAGIEYTDDIIEQLSVRFAFFLRRSKHGKHIQLDPAEREVIVNTHLYEISKQHLHVLPLSEGISAAEEIIYFTAHLLSARTNRISESMWGELGRSELLAAIYSFIREFEKFALVEIEDKRGLANNLSIHLQPAIFRMRYGIQMKDKSLEKVRENLNDVYILTKQSKHVLETFLGQVIPDEETAYLAMHFGSWLQQEGLAPVKKWKMLIVCHSGIGTSRLLESQLRDLLSDIEIIDTVSLRQYHDMDISDVDYIVSTISIPEREIPVIHVPIVFSETDKEILLNQINGRWKQKSFSREQQMKQLMKIIGRYAKIQDAKGLSGELQGWMQPELLRAANTNKQTSSLEHVLPAEHIRMLPSAGSWQEAVEEASVPLIENNVISREYVTAMRQNLLEQGPYVVIAPEIAMPHASSDAGVHQLGFSLLLLENPVDMIGKSVKLLIVVASPDDHSHLRALAELNQLLYDAGKREALLHVRDQESLVSIIHPVEQDSASSIY